MEDWIDIVKKRLQDAEAPLPPGDWEEFEAASLPARRTRVLPWLIPALAVAAGLAAVLFLRKPAVPEDGIQVAQGEVKDIPYGGFHKIQLEEPIDIQKGQCDPVQLCIFNGF